MLLEEMALKDSPRKGQSLAKDQEEGSPMRYMDLITALSSKTSCKHSKLSKIDKNANSHHGGQYSYEFTMLEPKQTTKMKKNIHSVVSRNCTQVLLSHREVKYL